MATTEHPAPDRVDTSWQSLGQLLLAFRQRRGLSRNVTARLLAVDASHIYRIEAGDRLPSLPLLARVAILYRLTMAERMELISAAGFPVYVTEEDRFSMELGRAFLPLLLHLLPDLNEYQGEEAVTRSLRDSIRELRISTDETQEESTICY